MPARALRIVLRASLLARLVVMSVLLLRKRDACQLGAEAQTGLEWRTSQVKAMKFLLTTYPPSVHPDALASEAKKQGFQVKQDDDGLWIGDVLVHFDGEKVSAIDTY